MLERIAADSTRTDQERAEAFYNLGNAQFKQEKYPEALESYKNSLRMNPADQEAKYNYAYTKRLLQKQQNEDQNKDQNKDQQNSGGQDQNQDKNKDNNSDKDLIKNKIAEHGEVILVLGTRKQESSRRNRTMTNLEKKRVRELLSPNPTLANELVFSPMEDWTDDDVWAFLMQYKNPWGYSNMDLMTMYRGATADNECPLQVDKSAPSCGKSRFGCWVCTMVEKDKSMDDVV